MSNQIESDAIIDDALRTYPPAPMPATLAPGVMARIETLATQPRFRLTAVDYALGVIGASVIGFVMLVWQMIAPEISTRAFDQLAPVMLDPRAGMWVMLIAGGIGVTASALALGAFALDALFRAPEIINQKSKI
ncbi:MAG: hypothetical protein HZC40_17085 [Chloroflexi bacterium]|nr:hypothetical protein [Chloroflexota bacterium]